MGRKVSYQNEAERLHLIEQAEQNDERLRVDAITIDGNYLIFSPASEDNDYMPKPSYVEELENQLLLMADQVNGGIL